MTCTILLQYGWENYWSNLAIFNQPKKPVALNILNFTRFFYEVIQLITTIQQSYKKRRNGKKPWSKKKGAFSE